MRSLLGQWDSGVRSPSDKGGRESGGNQELGEFRPCLRGHVSTAGWSLVKQDFFPEASRDRRTQGECWLCAVRLSLGSRGPIQKSKELEQLELKTKSGGPEGSQVDTGRKQREREITGKAEVIGFKTNDQRRPKCQQPMCMGLITGYADKPAWLDGQGPGWMPGTLMH